MNPDLAWAAGLYEGEGSVTVQHSHNHRKRYAQMSVTQRDRQVLDWFMEIVQAGSIYTEKGRSIWRWRATKHCDVERVLLSFAPYLSDRRLVQAASVLGARTAEVVCDQ